jgi:D-threo-aldose 1-dehydrogenase
MCAERGIAVVIGAPYASGILVRGPQPHALYNYRPAKPEIIARAERISAVCQRHDVPLAAAALQFPLGHRSVVAVIPGPVATEEVRKNLAWMRRDIPDALWVELKGAALIRADVPTPHLRKSS